MAVGDDAAARRARRAERAAHHLDAHRRRSEHESAQAQILIDRFVAHAVRAQIAAVELMARPWSGRGRYRTGILGWYLRRDGSIGVGLDGGYYVLLVPPVRLGRWRGVRVDPTPPPLEVGRGGRDGDAVALETLLQLRLRDGEPSGGDSAAEG